MIWWTFTGSAISCKELPLTQRSKSQSTPTPPKRAPQVSEEVAPEPESLENLLAQMEEMDVCRRAFLGLVEIKKRMVVSMEQASQVFTSFALFVSSSFCSSHWLDNVKHTGVSILLNSSTLHLSLHPKEHLGLVPAGGVDLNAN